MALEIVSQGGDEFPPVGDSSGLFDLQCGGRGLRAPADQNHALSVHVSGQVLIDICAVFTPGSRGLSDLQGMPAFDVHRFGAGLILQALQTQSTFVCLLCKLCLTGKMSVPLFFFSDR